MISNNTEAFRVSSLQILSYMSLSDLKYEDRVEDFPSIQLTCQLNGYFDSYDMVKVMM